MFNRIMVPVDLAHTETLEKALAVAADLAGSFGCPVTFVAVSAAAPGPLAHTPKEFAARLDTFAADQAARRGITAEAHAVTSHDPATDVDDALLAAVETVGADLVVMASHIPGLVDYVWPSNGGKMAAHSSASVFVVRTGRTSHPE